MSSKSSKQDGVKMTDWKCWIHKLAAEVKELKRNTAACGNQFIFNRNPLGLEQHNTEKGNYAVSSRLRNPTVFLLR